MRWEDRVYSFDRLIVHVIVKRTPRTAHASGIEFPKALNDKIGNGLIPMS
jgi:hypothetical protein